MKICICCGYYPDFKGGAEYQAKLLAQSLAKQGHDIIYISIGNDVVDNVRLEDCLKIYTINVTSIDKFALYYGIKRKMRKIIQDEKPNIIYQRILNSFSFHLSNIANEYQLPFHVHIADMYCLNFPVNFRSYLRKYMFNSVVKNNTSFIVQTDAQYNLLSNFGVIPNFKIYNLHPSPTTKYKIADRSTRKIVWIGSVRQVKQFEIYLKLASDCRNDTSLVFYVIGRFENNNYSNSLFRQIGKFSNVKYLGEIENKDVNKFLETTDVLINTSKSEGFSNTFVQAWLRGVPVISLNSDPDNLISNNALGYFCDNNYERLKQALIKLVDSDRSNLSNKIQQFANQHFALETKMPQFIDYLLEENINNQ